MPPTLFACAHLYNPGRPETGLWCEACSLPSALSYHWLLMTCKGKILKRGHVVVCYDCGKQWEPDED